MLRTLAISSFVLALTTGSVAALEAENIEDIVLLRAVYNTDPPGPSEDSTCLANMNPFNTGFFEIPHDDITSTTLFVVPDRTNLVITSYQWNSFDGDGTPTEGLLTHASTITGYLPILGTKTFKAVGRAFSTSGPADSTGGAGDELVMPTGIVIPAGAHICMQLGSSEGTDNVFGFGFIQGFLVHDKKGR
jgi:hypothetical protein